MSSEKIEKLKQTIIKNKMQYELFKRNDKAAIYEQIDPSINQVIGYEVFQIKIAKAYELQGKGADKKIYSYPMSERFPGNENFGSWAWSFTNKESAIKKFNEIGA